ncbi:YdeI/OmpD-associated family protein [Flagellimonas maritima]|nr:YdeI/OmpD-associated family protein [Allomuricauda aurantiaca]
MKDERKVLRNVQEGKTKGMRHWNFNSIKEIDSKHVLEYMIEAIENQKQGKVITIEKSQKKVGIPKLLNDRLAQKNNLRASFKTLSISKQKKFCNYILEAKQEKTKIRRLEKILPMIEKGVGLNDVYR